MEDAATFETWLWQCVEDGQKKLGIRDKTMAYILLREGLKYYLKSICKK